MYLLLCIFSSVMACVALSSWAAKQGNGFAVDEITGQITGIGDYRRALVQGVSALIGIAVALLLSNVDYRSLVKVWPVHVALTWGLVLPTLFIRNVTVGPLTIGYNAGDTDNYSWYKLGGFTLQPTELAKISFILTFAMHLNNVRGHINEPKELGKALAAYMQRNSINDTPITIYTPIEAKPEDVVPVQPAPAVEEDDNSYFDDILGLLNNRGNN